MPSSGRARDVRTRMDGWHPRRGRDRREPAGSDASFAMPAADVGAPLIDLRGDVRRLPLGSSRPRPPGERQSGATPS